MPLCHSSWKNASPMYIRLLRMRYTVVRSIGCPPRVFPLRVRHRFVVMPRLPIQAISSAMVSKAR
ncbi:MAG: hypothetical protein EFKGCFLK_02393 [Rhodocyclaceae bacterium]|nr:hypothetical protein [Rhodocyclaceae bacterium]